MEIIDCFCGIGPWATRDALLPYSDADILKSMDHFGISKALVYANGIKFGLPSQIAVQEVVEASRRDTRFIPAGVVDFATYAESPSIDQHMDTFRAGGVKAVWLKMPFTPYRLARTYARWFIGPWMTACEARRLPVLIHVEDEDPNLVHTLCSEYPALRVIATGFSYNSDYYVYPLLRNHPNLRVCLGHMYIPSGNPMRFLKQFPSSRLVFGSGAPEFSAGGMVAHVMYADIPETDKARILGHNMREWMEEVRL